MTILTLPIGWAEQADEIWVFPSGRVSLMTREMDGTLSPERTSASFFTPEQVQMVIDFEARFEDTDCPVVVIQ